MSEPNQPEHTPSTGYDQSPTAEIPPAPANHFQSAATPGFQEDSHPPYAEYGPPAPQRTAYLQQAYPQPQYQRVFIEKSPEQLEGEKLSKTSTILGIISIYFAGVILGPIAIIKASKAEKLGVDATVGKVTGWIGTIMAAISIVVAILYIFVLGAIFVAADANASDNMKTGDGFGYSKDFQFDQNKQPRDSRLPNQVLKDAAEKGIQIEGSNTYRDLSQADKDSLTKVAADAAKQVN